MKKLLLAVLVLLVLVGCSSKQEEDDKTISVACSPTPHAEILEKAAEILKEQGWTLEIEEFEDYVQPIEVVESDDVDANYFAHVPYLNNYNEEKGTHQVVVAKVHYEPFGIYPGTSDTLELSDDVVNEIIVPNDGTNETRALLLLQDIGFITLPSDTSAESIVTVNDIVSYEKNIKIVEMEAAQIARVKDSAALVVLNGNYALAAGLNVSKDALAYEKADSSAAQTYVNVLATKEDNANNEGLLALKEVLESKEIADFINSKYEGAVVPFNNYD